MRLFIASGLSAVLVERIQKVQALAGKHSGCGSVRWVRPQNLHLTYAFLGDVAADRVSAAKKSLEAAGRRGRIEVVLGGLGAFPSLKEPRVLWLGLEEKIPGSLNELALAIRNSLAAEGFVPERDFLPHITIGRLAEGREDLEGMRGEIAGIESVSTLTSVCLMESRISGSGPEYSVVSSVELL